MTEICDYCGRVFKTAAAIDRHLDLEMNKENGLHNWTIEEYKELGLPIRSLHPYQRKQLLKKKENSDLE